MPIRESQKHRYPKDWKKISLRIREKAGNKCEFCNAPNHQIIYRPYKDHRWELWPEGMEGEAMSLDNEHKPVKIILTVAHLDHQPENCADENLKALCQRCHLRYDNEHHRANARNTRNEKKGHYHCLYETT